MRAAAIIAAGLVHNAEGGCTGSVKQQITGTRQGNGWFTSLSSERKSAKNTTFPTRLSYWAQEEGMSTYGDTRSGAVLHFSGCNAPTAQTNGGFYFERTPYLHLVWNASQPNWAPGVLQGGAVLRVDATNCGLQRLDVGEYNQDCVAKNTPSTAANNGVSCYCMPAPCVLVEQAPERTSWMLNASNAAATNVMLPIPLSYFGNVEKAVLGGLTVRVTPLYSASPEPTPGLSYTFNIISAAIEYPTKTPPAPPTTSASDNLCYGYPGY